MYDINNPVIPFDIPIHGGFPHNAEIIILGKSLKGKDKVFVVEFGAAQDIPLHLSFRFKSSENKLVINSATYGNWQTEERHHNPIFHEHSFELKIQCKPKEFIIWQKHHKFEFRHRMDPTLINSLRIQGEVSIESIKFERFNQSGATPYANAPNPTGPPSYYPSPGQGTYPSGPGGDFGSNPSYRPPNIGGGTNPTPNIGGGAQFIGGPSIGGGSYMPYGSDHGQQYPPQRPTPSSGIGFGTQPSTSPYIGYGGGAPGGDFGTYPNLNDNTPNPNAPGGYPPMHPSRQL